MVDLDTLISKAKQTNKIEADAKKTWLFGTVNAPNLTIKIPHRDKDVDKQVPVRFENGTLRIQHEHQKDFLLDAIENQPHIKQLIRYVDETEGLKIMQLHKAQIQGRIQAHQGGFTSEQMSSHRTPVVESGIRDEMRTHGASEEEIDLTLKQLQDEGLTIAENVNPENTTE